MSRGGWRYGAGRPGWHAKTTDCYNLDVRDLQRRKLLDPGNAFTWTWSRGGQVLASIGARAKRDHLTLSFLRNGQPVDVDLEIQSTPCTFGGRRLWFSCPRCSRRVAIVYLIHVCGCRKCLGLVYPSQSENPTERSWRRTRKILAMARHDGGLTSIPRRPKRMWRKRYKRLWDAWMREDDFREASLEAYIARNFST